MSVATICLGCGDMTQAASDGRCPRCWAEWNEQQRRRRAQYERGHVRKRSPQAQRNRDAHQAIVNSRRWRKIAQQVKRRDGFACTECGTGRDLTVHHVSPARFADNPYDADNCITLCRRCHGRAEARTRRVRASQGMSHGGGGSAAQGDGRPTGDAFSDARGGIRSSFDDTDWIR